MQEIRGSGILKVEPYSGIGGDPMRGRKPHPLIIAAPDLPILQAVARARHLAWFQVQHARIVLAVATGEQIHSVADGIVDAISARTVRRILHDVELQPHRTRYWKTSRLDAQFKERAAKGAVV